VSSIPSFSEVFSALWGFDPFPWQTMLADRVAKGRWPAALDLPTASGKTACIDVALFALAAQADVPLVQRIAPRRIWFVVDRRIVVDEAFDRAQIIADKLAAATDGPLRVIADRLRRLAGTDRPCAVARLRGGVLRDDGWARLPSQPAVITSTVDQFGSRLLFRGYGRGQLTAPIFAGLAANDSLVLLDEAHCAVPFLQTVRAIERFRGDGWAEVALPSPFAALVTEAASLDALRQRFGRLDRMGTAQRSPAVILVRSRDADPAKSEPDPIYGAPLAKTWNLLTTKAGEARTIDFGIEALGRTLEDVDDLAPYLAPTEDAPTLLPAHLDLLCQTTTPPHPEPDVQQYLHGVGRGAPEVQVVWRADLGEDARDWVETVAMCRPVSGEMLAAPLWRVRSWLQGATGQDSTADIEGAATRSEDGDGAFRPCLLWRGRRSRVARSADDIAPGDVVVVPAAYGMEGLARPVGTEALGREQADLWERAMETAGRPAAVRLHRAVLAPWLACEPLHRLTELAESPATNRAELHDAIDAVLEYAPATEEAPAGPASWWCDLLRAARAGRIERHPAGGVILLARATKGAPEEPDLFADDDDLTCAAGADQSLDEHSELVRQTVERLASLCLPENLRQVTTDAAYWHDAGKLDERFQILLHQGDELAALAAEEPLAKSASIPASPAQRRALREASGLPERFRHEMLSTQLANEQPNMSTDEASKDLLLHLIASHHGYARPLAPICEDPEPPSVLGKLGENSLSLSSDERLKWIAHRVDSGLADRFWRLTRRHGWWGVAYLEAILRLGDWYASGLRAKNSSEETEVRS